MEKLKRTPVVTVSGTVPYQQQEEESADCGLLRISATTAYAPSLYAVDRIRS